MRTSERSMTSETFPSAAPPAAISAAASAPSAAKPA